MQRLLFLLVLIAVLVGFDTLNASNGPLDGFVDPASLEVLSISFAADSYSKANYDPFIKIQVYNNSEYEIVRAYIRVTVTIDNGQHKVFSERFVKFINGAMPAYSVQTWLFYPRKSSFWALHDIPPDAQIEAEVEKVFCAKKNSPWQYEYEFNYPSRHDMFY